MTTFRIFIAKKDDDELILLTSDTTWSRELKILGATLDINNRLEYCEYRFKKAYSNFSYVENLVQHINRGNITPGKTRAEVISNIGFVITNKLSSL